MPSERLAHARDHRLSLPRKHALAAISANVLIFAWLQSAHAQQVEAGFGETKTAPAAVSTNAEAALFAHHSGHIRGTGSVIETTGNYAYGALAEIGGTIGLARGTITTDGFSATGLYAFGGGSSIVSSADVATLGVSAHAAFARAGGNFILDGGQLRTSGPASFGLLADGSGSRTESHSSIVTTGPNSNGVAATNGGTILLKGGTINTSGAAAFGLYSSGAGSIVESEINVLTTGSYGHGVVAQSGGAVVLTAGTIATSGDGAAGLLSEGVETQVTSSARISTAGADAIGIFSRSSGLVNHIGEQVSTTGARAHGLYAAGSDSRIISSALARTTGEGASGAFADAGGSIVVSGAIETTGRSASGLLSDRNMSSLVSTAQVNTTGEASYGAQAVNGGSISLTGGTIATSGEHAQGIRSFGSGSSVTSLAQVTTSGSQAAGVAALSGGTAQLLGGSITTTGTGEGLYAFGLGSSIIGSADVTTSGERVAAALADGRATISLSGGTIRTSGTQAPGLVATYGSTLSANSALIEALGAGSPGAYVSEADLNVANSQIRSSGAGIVSLGNASIRVNGSTMRSGGAAFDARFDLSGQSATFNIRNSQVQGAAGLLNVTRGDNGRDGVVAMILDGSVVAGSISDTEPRTSGYTDVTLSDRSKLTGGVDGIRRLSLDNGTWTIAGRTGLAELAIGPAGGTLDMASQSATLNAPITGSGAFNKAGMGTLTLSGDSTLSGSTYVQAGTLVVIGSLRNSPVIVRNGAILSGNSTIAGLIADQGSTVAPGTKSGTLSVNGNVIFLPKSTYVVRLGTAGQSDRIVASGQAILSGGSVQVFSDQGAVYKANHAYMILSAGSLNGEFEGVESDGFAFLTSALSYSSNAAMLTLARKGDPDQPLFSSVALTRNQYSTANAIEVLGAGNTLYDTVLGASVNGARLAFDALSGEIYGSAVTTGYRDAERIQSVLLARLRQPLNDYRPVFAQGVYPTVTSAESLNVPAGAVLAPVYNFNPRHFSLWGEGFGSWSKSAANGNAAGLGSSTSGFIVGAETRVGQQYRIGISGGSIRTSFDADARMSSGSNEAIFGSFYGGASWRALNMRLGASYAALRTDTQRIMRFPGFADTASAAYNGWTAQAFAEMGYRFGFARGEFEPIVNASFAQLHTNDFVENGGPAALIGHAQSHSLGTTTVGIRVAAQPSMAVPLRVQGLIGWRHTYGEIEPKAQLTFGEGSAPFTIWGAPLDRDTLVVEASADLQMTMTTSLGVSYNGQLGLSTQDHAVKGSFVSRF